MQNEGENYDSVTPQHSSFVDPERTMRRPSLATSDGRGTGSHGKEQKIRRDDHGDDEVVDNYDRQDDESHQYDRGEELVRRRMRARKRERLIQKRREQEDSPVLRPETPVAGARAVPAQILDRASRSNDTFDYGVSPGASHLSEGTFPSQQRQSGSSRFSKGECSASNTPSRGDSVVEHDESQQEDEQPGDTSNDGIDEEQSDDHDPLEYTIKDRQDAFNIEHPFGLPIWKPALYKKSRTVTRKAETAVHCSPDEASGADNLLAGNIAWTVLFGAALAVLAFAAGLLLRIVPNGGRKYSRVLFELASYIFWPFGNYVELECTHDSGEREVDHDGHAHINADEGTSLRPAGRTYGTTDPQERIMREIKMYHYVYDNDGRDVMLPQRRLGRLVYAFVYALILFPSMGIVCLMSYFFVLPIPMAHLLWELLANLRVQPLALHFRSPSQIDPERAGEEHMWRPEHPDYDDSRDHDSRYRLKAGQMAPTLKAGLIKKGTDNRRSKILLCTYRGMGLEYFKYTVGGVNIMFINTLPIVFITIFLFFVVRPLLRIFNVKDGLLVHMTSDGFIFVLALASVLPLSYFIGMAVASISTQSSIGMGAVINATFGSIIEVILYSIALADGRSKLVEGSLIGSILAGVLLMPGMSMCSGATRRKEQKYNARSAGVTSTMLIMAIIGILAPTVFYQIYGTFELECEGCPDDVLAPNDSWKCTRCRYEQVPPTSDPFFEKNMKGLVLTCTATLVLSYVIGLWFSLRTHASQIWQSASSATQQPSQHLSTHPIPDSIPPHMRRASVYQRLLPASYFSQLPTHNNDAQGQSHQERPTSLRTAPGSLAAESTRPQATSQKGNDTQKTSDLDQMLESLYNAYHYVFNQRQQHQQKGGAPQAEPEEGGGGHEAPSWSRMTSTSVLLGCTVLYAIIAEVLVDVVDVVLDGSGLSQKFVGATLFALVPNTTEFMNAMSFAISGNIALSMEIGSAYVLQVCLIQIPYMVLFSLYYNATSSGLLPGSVEDHTFTLIFPRWDVIAIFISVFLLTYTYIEARSNYHRGSILILSYVVLIAGFFFAPDNVDAIGPGSVPLGTKSWLV